MKPFRVGVRSRAVGAIMSLGMLMTIVGPMSAALADPVPYPTTPLSSWRTNGVVYTTKIVGDTVYLGGSFTEMVSPSGTRVPRSNVAAVHRVSGDLLSFRADTDAVVQSIDSNGSRVFLGGSFLLVNGSSARRLAAVHPVTGQVDSTFGATPSGRVYAVHVSGNDLFVGGGFGNVNGQAYPRLVALDATTGAIRTGFRPNPDNTVRSIVASPDSSRLYVGGSFRAIGGTSRRYLVELDSSNGAATGAAFSDANAQVITLDISDDGSRVFGGVAGSQNRATAYSASTHARIWAQQAMGDVQAVRYAGGNLYFGFHEGFQNDLSVRMLAADADTGAIINTFRPTINSFYGVWAIDATPQSLVVGGQFTQFEGVFTPGIAILNSENNQVDVQPPSIPTELATNSVTTSSVALSWRASTDNLGVDHYLVRRNGLSVGSPTGTNFTDAGLSPGTSYQYTVEAVDAAGNVSGESNALTVTTDTGSGSAVTLVTPGSVWSYLDDGSDQGSGWRQPAFDDSGWASGPAQLGYGDGDENTVTTRNGLTTYFRHGFTSPNTAQSLELGVVRDDGVIVYLNGTEVWRDNMPTGAVTNTTAATQTVSGSAESTFNTVTIDAGLLQAGANVIAAEIHQRSNGSSDISFDLRMTGVLDDGTPPPPDTEAPSVPSGLSVDTVTDNSVSLSWNPSSDNQAVDHYVVRRDGSIVGSPTGTSFTNTGLTSSTAYTYTVQAVDTSNNTSAQSAPVNATTADPPPGPVTLIAPGSVWSYLDDGSDQGSGWRQPAFDDSGWASGPAQLGYGDGDENTVTTRNGLTTYFRQAFSRSGSFTTLDLSAIRDDGIVVYLNGTEIWRDNMPAGPVTIETRASTYINGNAERAWVTTSVPASALVAGSNVIAVEIHQHAANSSDISFDLELIGS